VVSPAVAVLGIEYRFGRCRWWLRSWLCCVWHGVGKQQPDVVWAVPGDNLGGEAVTDASHLASVTRQLIPA